MPTSTFKALLASAAVSSALAAKCLNSKTMNTTCITHDSRERCWYMHVPDGLDVAGAPLVVDFHGYSSCAEYCTRYTGWRQIADVEKFIVAWPQGTEDLQPAPGDQSSWNAGKCCGAAAEVDLTQSGLTAFDIDDEGFVVKMIESIQGTHTVDAARVYMAGHSNGCSMAQRMAAHQSSLVAAMGCHSMYLFDEAKDYVSPVPIIEVHGTGDPTVNYTNFFGRSANDNAATWADLNGCTEGPVITQQTGYSTTAYTGCKNGADVRLLTLPEINHTPYKLFLPNVYCSSVCGQAEQCYTDEACVDIEGSCNIDASACAACYPDSPCGSKTLPPGFTDIDTTQLVWDFMKNFQKSTVVVPGPVVAPTAAPVAAPVVAASPTAAPVVPTEVSSASKPLSASLSAAMLGLVLTASVAF